MAIENKEIAEKIATGELVFNELLRAKQARRRAGTTATHMLMSADQYECLEYWAIWEQKLPSAERLLGLDIIWNEDRIIRLN